MEKRLATMTGYQVKVFETIDSTNSEARRMAEDGAGDRTLLYALSQTNGRGRRGRSWVMPPKSAIAMSLLLRPELEPSHASMITLVMGLAVADACRDYCGVDTQIKWPNDVVAGGRKVCGILTEMSSTAEQIQYVIIGTGINTAVEQFPPELEQTAVSLHHLMGAKPDPCSLAACCIQKFETYYQKFLQTQDLSLLMDAYNARLAGKGGLVRVLEPGNEYCGTSEGINARGELLVRREDGTREAVYAGEVSVRGIYGYV